MTVAMNELIKNGFNVDSLGLFEHDSGDIKTADVLLLPVPTTRDGENIFCPLTNRKLPLDLVYEAKPDALILSCGYSFQDKRYIDYLTLDSFCLLNAVPTAEGAISRAIEDTPFCLWGSRVLVVGNGRVGRVLAERLLALKCDLTVSARKASDFALLEAMGIKHIHTNTVCDCAENFDIIFNTVDVPIFKDLEVLKNCFFYDLSTKGCLDFNEARRLGIKAAKLPGIPGKVAPHTAGKIIAQTVTELTLRGDVIWNI